MVGVPLKYFTFAVLASPVHEGCYCLYTLEAGDVAIQRKLCRPHRPRPAPIVLSHSILRLSHTSSSIFLLHDASSSNSQVLKMPRVSKQKAHLKAIRKRKRRCISKGYLILLQVADLSQDRVQVLA